MDYHSGRSYSWRHYSPELPLRPPAAPPKEKMNPPSSKRVTDAISRHPIVTLLLSLATALIAGGGIGGFTHDAISASRLSESVDQLGRRVERLEANQAETRSLARAIYESDLRRTKRELRRQRSADTAEPDNGDEGDDRETGGLDRDSDEPPIGDSPAAPISNR